jgi:hypothetical protein
VLGLPRLTLLAQVLHEVVAALHDILISNFAPVNAWRLEISLLVASTGPSTNPAQTEYKNSTKTLTYAQPERISRDFLSPMKAVASR